MDTLTELFSSRVKAKICGMLFGLQSEALYLRELARRTGCTYSAVQYEVEKLARAGLITRRHDGNRNYYQANPKHPFYPELCGLIRKSRGLKELLAEALADSRIKLAFIFGSVAAEKDRADSDVDLMVVGSISPRDVAERLFDLTSQLGREINPHVFFPAEFARRISLKDHFISTVLREPKVFVIGDECDLAGMAD